MLRDKDPLILVVDRDVETLTSLYSILDDEGYLVATVHPTIEALKYVVEHKPDLMIVDREALEGSRMDLIGKVRENSPGTRILVVFSGKGKAPEAQRSGADLLLSKPYSRFEVLECVGALLPAAPSAKI